MTIDKIKIVIPRRIEEKWQETVNIAAQIINVPSALIMKIDAPYIKVYKSSQSSNNVYKVGDKELLPGLYCETVINSKKMLLVPNALKDKNWDQNPDIKLGMISYLGFPLSWPDGDPFGTICVLDSKENNYSKIYESFLLSFKRLIEAELELIVKNEELNEFISLKKSAEDSLSNLISNLDGMVYHCKNDIDWTMDFVSIGSLALTGYKPYDLEANRAISYNEIIHPDDREKVWDEVQEALKKKKPFALNYRITTSEGKLKYVFERGRGVWLENGKLEGLQGFIMDVTEDMEKSRQLKLTQKQLLHSEKLASLGKLTGSISHEFNNPLQGIRNVINILSKSALSENDVKFAKLGKKECDRIAKMIRDLRDFYKPTSGKVSSMDINKCLEEVIALQIPSLQERCIQVNQHFSDKLPKADLVEDQIKQVIFNLILNAADSISGEGRITLTTEKQDSHIIIKIQDTGSGISEDDTKHLFEPFFSTKEGKGTGLGLSISYGIIRDHGGDIKVKSELDKGTTFTIILPFKG
jgi:PAS domain S-box-containing protein